VNFNGTITANAPCTVRYVFVRSDGVTSPEAIAHFMAPGSRAVSTSRTFAANFTGWMKIRVVSPVMAESAPAAFQVHVGGPPPPGPLAEDLVPFNWVTAHVQHVGPTWIIADGGMSLLSFGGNLAEANRALAIIKHYKMNAQGFVQRPNPRMTYYLCSGSAPVGPFPGEDAIPFNPALLTVQPAGLGWQLKSGALLLFTFPTQAQADKAKAIIQHYGFTRICYVGRPDPSMTYFRK